jgi:hypothetical protein
MGLRVAGDLQAVVQPGQLEHLPPVSGRRSARVRQLLGELVVPVGVRGAADQQGGHARPAQRGDLSRVVQERDQPDAGQVMLDGGRERVRPQRLADHEAPGGRTVQVQ